MKEDTESQDMGLDITRKAIEMLKTVYDPEIPVNVYDLGLIYKIDYDPADKTLVTPTDADGSGLSCRRFHS